MKFTEAQEKDITLIQQLARKSWEKAYVGIISTEQIEYMLGTMYSTEEITKHLHHPNYFYFLIQKEEEVFGFIGFEHHFEPETTKLHRLYLLPEAKGKGYGKAALDFMKQKVLTSGDKRIILNVNKENPAHNVYKSQGFQVYKEIVLDIGNGFVMDDFLMEFKH